MRRLLNCFVSVSTALILTPAHAASVPVSMPPMAESSEAEAVADSNLSPVAEFWQIMQTEMAEELREFRESIAIEVRAALVPTGEAEADWQTKGIDLRRHIESMPGGIGHNGLLTLGEVPSLEFFGKIPAGLLSDWEFVQAGPKAVSPFEAKRGIFIAISPNHVLFEADEEMEVGNARCMKDPVEKASDHVTVYRYSGTTFEPENDASLEAEAEAIVMYNVVGSLSSPVICSIIQRDQAGDLRSLAYSPDGRPLGQMNNEKDQLQIVSRFDLYEQLSANYTSAFIDEELMSTAEEASEPS
ncbi:MAG: hypothetical protein V7679_04465 [Parasphingorhabdus sp.]